MTGSALNLALTLVVHHDELENVKHGALVNVEVSGACLRDSNPFPLDQDQKVGLHLDNNLVWTLWPEVPG